MKQWRIRLMIVLGVLVLLAPTFTSHTGTHTQRQWVTAADTTAATDNSGSSNVQGDGGNPVTNPGSSGEDPSSGEAGHFGW